MSTRHLWTEALYAPVGGVYYRRPDGLLAWRSGLEVVSISIEDITTPERATRLEIEGDPRDALDTHKPVPPDALAAWVEGERGRLQARVEQAEGALAEATERAEDARRRLWLLRADLAALGEGAG